ncbi:MAG: histidine--tRNA ligase [Chloroflexi bacterium]|nr:histidine--tRNA ligase [Chloroflexota bacterium]
MAKTVKPKLPRGMRDILPQKMILRQYVVRIIQEVFEEFGFEPLQTPSVELEETLKGKYGPDAERMIYDVGHRGGKEKLALRYDLSVPLCRVIAQYPELPKPFKRYQIAPVWRAERPQKGRYREFYQCDADTVGSASMLADAEIINVTCEILTRLGFEQFVVNVNNRKIITGIGQFAGVPDELLGGLYRSIDKLDKIGLEGVRAELRKTLTPDAVIERMIEFLQIGGGNREILAQLRERLADYPESLAGVAELEEMIGYLEALGVPERYYQIVPAMVRGLEYYTGPIYETIVEKPNIGSITGGGRYDELVGMFTNRSYPATGTTIGIERIIDVMEELEMFPSEVGKTVAQVLVAQFNPDMVTESLKMARELRQAGLNTELYFETKSLGEQIRYALKKGIPYVVILGPDEVAAGQVTIRNLGLGQQEIVPRGKATAQIKAWRETDEQR